MERYKASGFFETEGESMPFDITFEWPTELDGEPLESDVVAVLMDRMQVEVEFIGREK